jgi:hypothetical protein
LSSRNVCFRMKSPSPVRWLAASSLSLLLVSCTATRYSSMEPTGPGELSHFVLIIHEMPDGQATHSWQRTEEFDFSQYPPLSSAKISTGQVVPTAWTRDCEQERDECEDDCMQSRLRPGFGHVTTPDRKRGAKYDLCRQKCMQPYLDCCRLRELEPVKFTALDGAIDWLKRHRREVLVGSVIVIAGVVFITVTAGAGVLVLVPAVLVTSSGLPAEPSTAAVSP